MKATADKFKNMRKKEPNLLMGEQKQQEPEEVHRVDTKMIPPHSIRSRHLESGLFAIKTGLATDRPETGDETRFYFATDTGVFSAWTGTAWLSETLT
jgi:hypothetical protein